jgi:hypothetical protein
LEIQQSYHLISPHALLSMPESLGCSFLQLKAIAIASDDSPKVASCAAEAQNAACAGIPQDKKVSVRRGTAAG